MKFDSSRDPQLLLPHGSNNPLFGNLGCIKYQTVKSMSDYSYIPIENMEEYEHYMNMFLASPGEYKDPVFLPSIPDRSNI